MPNHAVENNATDKPILALKVSKENFVSNHSGTGLLELCLLVALVPTSAFVLRWCCCKMQPSYLARAASSSWLYMLIQFTFVVIPTVLAVMSPHTPWLLEGVLCISTLALACRTLQQEHVSGLTRSLQYLAEQNRKRSVLKQTGIKPKHICTAAPRFFEHAVSSPQCGAPPYYAQPSVF